MATVSVSLPKEMVEFIEGSVADGGYPSSSEVVREAIGLLRREKALENEKAAILKREIGTGLDAASAGRFSTRTVAEITESVLNNKARS